MAMLLAHQGGWDEALFVAVPVALFALLLARAKRSAEAEQAAERDAERALAPDGDTSAPDRPEADER